jgi:hypothetical protein
MADVVDGFQAKSYLSGYGLLLSYIRQGEPKPKKSKLRSIKMKNKNLITTILVIVILLLFSNIGIAQNKYEIKDTHVKMGLSCTVCHGDKSPQQRPEKEACLTCHKSYGEVAAKTKGLEPNPHESHQGEVTCSDCHSAHGTSRLMCNDCHKFTNFKMK